MVVKIGKIILVMIKRTFFVSLVTFTFTVLFFFIFTQSAQAVTSNCVIVNINIQGTPANLPPNCNSGVGAEGITYPPNITCKSDGYCLMPVSSIPAPKELYTLYACSNQRYGHKDLVGVLNTVAIRWKEKYPNGKLWIGDLNASGHKSHNIGRAVDIYGDIDGKRRVAQMSNDTETIELGKMFVDTNLIENIWYNDQAVNAAVLKYARDTNRSTGLVMKYIAGHDDHFHVDIKLQKKLTFWEPGC